MTPKSRLRLEKDCLPVGRIIKPHGVKGEVKAHPYSGNPGSLKNYEEFILPDGKGGQKSYAALRVRAGGKHAILQLQGISSRDEAEALRGMEIQVRKADVPALDADEFLWADVVGLRVMTPEGKDIGRVSAIMATGGHDILVVTGRGKEYLIPATREIMGRVDREAGLLMVRPVPGLLEIND